MKNIFYFIIVLAIFQPAFSYAQVDDKQNTALIIIDIQEFYFPGGSSALVDPEKASTQASKVLEHFRKNKDLIVHVKHVSKKDSAIHKNVMPANGEKLIRKEHVNSYVDTDLLAYLRESKVTKVVICGMMTHMCVEAASRASADYSFDVTVIDDACATRDIVYNNDTVRAADVHASTLGTINRYYGSVMTTDEFLNQ